MKLGELRGEAIRAFVKSMLKERLQGEAFRVFVEGNLDFPRWGFTLSGKAYFKRSASTTLIYDSERCRVRFDLSNIGRLPQEDELYVSYGRLHAPDDRMETVWRGEKCRCWHHSIFEPVLFLEGYTPEQILDYRRKEGEWPLPPVLAERERSEQGREFREKYPPAGVISREALIWETYGNRFFDLFDLRKPDLWEAYQTFVRQYYAEYERLFPPRPIGGDQPLPRDKIC